MSRTAPGIAQEWPRLRLDDWTETRTALHLWSQIVGKIRMSRTPLINHWWAVTLYVTPRGLSTSGIDCPQGMFDIEFDFVEHGLTVRGSDGSIRGFELTTMSVADFYTRIVENLAALGVETAIQTRPNEVEEALDFTEDHQVRPYDSRAANLFWRQLLQAHRGFVQFRAHFTGKVSPVHFFWGGFDLACTRFSGKPAPKHAGGAPNCGDWVMVEGYSHELSSCGFWPGGGEEGAFYSYAYPEPEGYAEAAVMPTEAYYSKDFRQFLLPYERVRTSGDPDLALSEFLHSTYDAAADCGKWDREALETDPQRWATERSRTRRTGLTPPASPSPEPR
ncbi:DUF5996 family protein [Streptomyces sp. NPDC059374]|uniref:DUF5996 family protein n=1 Tax=Streptomyces sp. NPDC059374 TaxID=3346814 RepID=UPI0036AAAE1F